MKTGKIRIKDKVYFEYYELEKPRGFPEEHFSPESAFFWMSLEKEEMEKYEASKRLIEVDNVLYQYEGDRKIYYIIFDINKYSSAFDNVSCKAELNFETATIIELIK